MAPRLAGPPAGVGGARAGQDPVAAADAWGGGGGGGEVAGPYPPPGAGEPGVEADPDNDPAELSELQPYWARGKSSTPQV